MPLCQQVKKVTTAVSRINNYVVQAHMDSEMFDFDVFEFCKFSAFLLWKLFWIYTENFYTRNLFASKQLLQWTRDPFHQTVFTPNVASDTCELLKTGNVEDMFEDFLRSLAGLSHETFVECFLEDFLGILPWGSKNLRWQCKFGSKLGSLEWKPSLRKNPSQWFSEETPKTNQTYIYMVTRGY